MTRVADASARQRRALEPTESVWVAASAGTGKTKVLTDRLLALMLGLVISGLAYTVEAAATAGLVATLYAWLRRELNLTRLAETLHLVMKLTAMVFMLLMGPRPSRWFSEASPAICSSHTCSRKCPEACSAARPW